MSIVKTKSFELAVVSRGDKDSAKLALLLPGRLDTKDYINFISHAEYLAGLGFFAVSFDPPGTWESPGAISLFTTTNYIMAANELIEYFGNKPTLLLGHSRGATVSILASSNPAVFGIVPIMANFGSPDIADDEVRKNGFKQSFRDLPPGSVKTKEQKEFLLPKAYWDDGKQYNASEVLKICTKPKLLIYAAKDKFTAPQVAEELFKQTSEPKMIKMVDSTHGYRYYPDIIKKIDGYIGEFLNSKVFLKINF